MDCSTTSANVIRSLSWFRSPASTTSDRRCPRCRGKWACLLKFYRRISFSSRNLSSALGLARASGYSWKITTAVCEKVSES